LSWRSCLSRLAFGAISRSSSRGIRKALCRARKQVSLKCTHRHDAYTGHRGQRVHRKAPRVGAHSARSRGEGLRSSATIPRLAADSVCQGVCA
jgi:hypothetical protein